MKANYPVQSQMGKTPLIIGGKYTRRFSKSPLYLILLSVNEVTHICTIKYASAYEIYSNSVKALLNKYQPYSEAYDNNQHIQYTSMEEVSSWELVNK